MIKVEKTNEERVLKVFDLDNGSAMEIDLLGNPMVIFEHKYEGDSLLWDEEESKCFPFDSLTTSKCIVLTIDYVDDALLYEMLCFLDDNHIYSFMSEDNRNQINIMRTKWALYVELERLKDTFSDTFSLSEYEPKRKLFSLIMNAFMVYSNRIEAKPKGLKLRGVKSENRFN